MAKYKEEIITETITTREYTRAYKVDFRNPLSNNFMVVFAEERVREINGGDPESIGNVGFLEEAATNLKERFDLLNPLDDTTIGSMTYEEVYAVIYSLYFHCAAKRDS